MGALAAGVTGPPDSADPVLQLLRSPVGLSLLRQQCAEEHSTENLDLWTGVESLLAIPKHDWGKRVAAGRVIFQRHIARNAAEQINLPSAVTEDLEMVVRTLEEEAGFLSDGLILAQNIALKLLSNDSYKRFMAASNGLGQRWTKFQAENKHLFAQPSFAHGAALAKIAANALAAANARRVAATQANLLPSGGGDGGGGGGGGLGSSSSSGSSSGPGSASSTGGAGVSFAAGVVVGGGGAGGGGAGSDAAGGPNSRGSASGPDPMDLVRFFVLKGETIGKAPRSVDTHTHTNTRSAHMGRHTSDN